MDFGFTDDQGEIKRTARELLGKRASWERLRACTESASCDEELWRELVGLGWPGIAVSESYGGQGLGVVELGILLEEAGYALAATPLLSTASAALVLQRAGSAGQRERWLGGLASGELKGALGTTPAGHGAAELVPDADAADLFVLVDEQTREARLLERADADVELTATIDPTRRYGRVRGSGEQLAGDVAGGLDAATVALSAELVGICQRALDMTLEYVRERKQFGTPVGAYQAVSHRCAAMLLATESARSTTLYAAWAADADAGLLAEAAALAKAAASDAGREVCASAIQAHGGIGFTWEADVHWLYKRAQMDAALLGGARQHRATLARIVGARLAA
ncbi:MAG: acyl-CoA dehydrogenase family protein [Solirubrobacteraceae bacterium]